MKSLFLILVAAPSFIIAQIQWELLGGPYRAEVHSFLETSESHLLAGTMPIEIFRSTDGGFTWDSSGTGLPNLVETTAQINVLKKDLNGDIYCGSDLGVHYSNDKGYTWEDRNFGYGVYTLITNSVGNVYAGGHHVGIYYTSDKGISWNRIDNGSLNKLVYALEIISDNNLIAGTGLGIYYSSDAGNSWTPSSGLISSANVTCFTKTNNTLFAGTTNGTFISIDNGITWEQRINGIENLAIHSLTVNEIGNVFAGTFTDGVFKTTNAGVNWISINEGIQLKNIIALYCCESGNIFCTNYSGEAYKSTNNGDLWISLYPQFHLSDVNKIIQYENNELFISSFSSGIQYSSDNGSNWEFRNRNLCSPSIYEYCSTQNNIQFAIVKSDIGASLFRSSNQGMDWQLLLPDSLTSVSKLGVGLDSIIFLVKGGKIFRSTDYGDNWIKIGTGLNIGIAFDFKFPGLNKVLLACDEGLYYSSNNGDDWTKFTESDNHSVFAIHLLDGIRFFINVNGWNGSSGSQLKYTDDFGLNWIDIDNGLPNNFIFTNVFSTSNGEIFASISSNDENFRIAKALDFEFSWSAIQGDLPEGFIRAMLLGKDNRLLVGLGSEAGIFRTIEPVTYIRKNEKLSDINFELFNNYPNPFNPSTKIEFRIANFGFVSLKVYDILGREITTLVNEEKPAGEYDVQFNANGLTSGVYFYQLKAGNYLETKKMILLK